VQAELHVVSGVAQRPSAAAEQVSPGLDEPRRRQRGGKLGIANAQAAGRGALHPCFGFTPLECRLCRSESRYV
jgi:hypothetical protein